jgi:hypothetical protein
MALGKRLPVRRRLECDRHPRRAGSRPSTPARNRFVVMWNWIADTFRPRHPLDRDLGTPRALRRFIATLPVDRPEAALQAVSRVFAASPGLGLASDARLRALAALDEFAQPFCRSLSSRLLENPARQIVNESAWNALFEHQGATAAGYAQALEALAHDGRDSGLHAHATLAACRAVHATAKCNMLQRMRYREAPPQWWPRLECMLAASRARSQSSAMLALYPGDAAETCLAHEYLVALLFEMAPNANLLPGQVHGVDLLLRQYAVHYRMGEAFDRAALPFVLDPAGEARPTRWLEGLPLRAGLRFFGPGEGYAHIQAERARAAGVRGIPDWLAPSQLSTERYREMLERLSASWALTPPVRRQRRDTAAGEILVVHDLAQVRRLIGFVELAHSGRSLEYEHFSAYATNGLVRGNGEHVQQAPGEPKQVSPDEALRNLETFEHALEADAIEIWRMADASEDGLGLEAVGQGAWARAGMLVAYRSEDQPLWSLAVVRRLNRAANASLRIGLRKLRGTPQCARVAVNDPRRHPRKSPAGPALHYDAIKLAGEDTCLLLPPGVFDPSWRYTLTIGHRWDFVRMQRCIECGLDFEQIAFTTERAQQAA